MKKRTHLDYLKSFEYLEFFKEKTYQYFSPLIKIWTKIFSKKKNTKLLIGERDIGLSNISRMVIEDDIIIVRKVVSSELTHFLRQSREKRNVPIVVTAEERLESSYSLSLVPQILRTQLQAV